MNKQLLCMVLMSGIIQTRGNHLHTDIQSQLAYFFNAMHIDTKQEQEQFAVYVDKHAYTPRSNKKKWKAYQKKIQEQALCDIMVQHPELHYCVEEQNEAFLWYYGLYLNYMRNMKMKHNTSTMRLGCYMQDMFKSLRSFFHVT